MDTHSRYTVSLHYDRRLYRQDIAGSVAHARDARPPGDHFRGSKLNVSSQDSKGYARR